MATQLTRRRIFSSLSDDAPVLIVPSRYLVALAVACVAIVHASLVAAIYNAERDEAAAERLYADTRTLIEAPAPDLEAQAAELDAANETLANAEALMRAPTIDPASDEATALLVRRAQASGLTVTSIARIDTAQQRTAEAAYDVQAIRTNVEGPVEQVGDFLYQMHTADPALIATLTSMTAMPAGVVQAEIVFSVYTRIEEPSPGAEAAP